MLEFTTSQSTGQQLQQTGLHNFRPLENSKLSSQRESNAFYIQLSCIVHILERGQI